MVKATSIELYGNQLKVRYDDGSSDLALPTGSTLWLISGTGGGPGPGTGDFSWPFNPDTTITSEYGPRSGGAGSFHEGCDFGKGNAVEGASIYNIGDGTVTAASGSSGYGPFIDVFLGTQDGHDLYVRYGHLDSFSRWSVGATIAKGALVGLESDGGVSEGANLHMETHLCAVGGSIINDLVDHTPSNRTAIDPRTFFASYGDGGVLNP